jgi:F-type H+-transporting ATPase subunit delta
MRACIGNPGLGIAQKADLVKALCGNAVEGDLAKLIDTLAENERLSVIPEIAGVFEGLKGVEEGVRDAVIHTAFPLEEAQQKKLLADLETRFSTKLKATVVVDASLIGGVMVVVGDQIIDLSVRGKLDAMAAALKN